MSAPLPLFSEDRASDRGAYRDHYHNKVDLIAANDDPRVRALAFAKRVYPMRNLGLLLLTLPYASVLHEQGAAWPYWILVVLNVLVWPHVAFLRAYSAREPMKAEFRNLVIDAAFGAFWIAASKVSLVPAAAMISILAADRLAAGSWPLLLRATLAGVVSFLLSGWMLGWPFHPQASVRTMLLALPSVLVYMLALSHVGHQLTRRIAQQNRELERLILTDPGVDLPNRRYFNARAGDLVASSRAGKGETVLLLLDVDRFKSINDHYGHGAGDEVLREVGRLLREQAGAKGFPARIGGDEFALLLPAGLPEGEAAAARLRHAVAELSLPRWPDLQVGVSIGVALLAPHHRGLDDWMGASDRAMYVAKAAGRTRF